MSADSTLCPLTNLGSVYVDIGTSGVDSSINIDKSTLQSSAELELRKAKVIVQASGKPLVVTISATGTDNKTMFAVSIVGELTEAVALDRLQGHTVYVDTWEESYIGIVGANNVQGEINTEVKDVIDVFLNDYLKDNPPVTPITPAPLRR